MSGHFQDKEQSPAMVLYWPGVFQDVAKNTVVRAKCASEVADQAPLASRSDV